MLDWWTANSPKTIERAKDTYFHSWWLVVPTRNSVPVVPVEVAGHRLAAFLRCVPLEGAPRFVIRRQGEAAKPLVVRQGRHRIERFQARRLPRSRHNSAPLPPSTRTALRGRGGAFNGAPHLAHRLADAEEGRRPPDRPAADDDALRRPRRRGNRGIDGQECRGELRIKLGAKRPPSHERARDPAIEPHRRSALDASPPPCGVIDCCAASTRAAISPVGRRPSTAERMAAPGVPPTPPASR